MKKGIVWLLLFALALSLLGCTTQPAPEGETEASVEETVPEEPMETTVPEVPEAAFDGYTCIYEEQRDREWEEDIVYFARLYLGEFVVKGHPYLTARLISIMDLENAVTQRYFYDAALRDRFIAEIKELIGKVPDLTDNQIAYELMRISALLGDAHTQVYLRAEAYFPLVVDRMENNGELGLYVTRIHQNYENLIFSELVSINGVPVEEVVDRLSVFVATENAYWADTCVTSIFYEMLIVDLNALRAAGIVGHEANNAVFGFRTDNGNVTEVNLKAVDLIRDGY